MNNDIPKLRPDLYTCRHFNKEWTKSIDKNAKGLAGENGLYEALRLVARQKKYQQVEQLGEPDLVDDPSEAHQIGEISDFPDCYLRVDDTEYLFESKNIFFYFGNWGGRVQLNNRQRGSPFYMEPAWWVKSRIASKKWNEPRYPVRGSGKVVWKNGKSVKEYTQWMVLHNTQKVRKVYVSTCPSYNGQKAWNELFTLFGGRMVFTHHPILSSSLCSDEIDARCRETTFQGLAVELSELIEGNRQ